MTDRQRIEEWLMRYGPSNGWTGTSGSVAAAVHRLLRAYDVLHDAITDIAIDYNINEAEEGIPIEPGHKRCVDRAYRGLNELEFLESKEVK